MRDPDFAGLARAWRMELGEGTTPDQEATLAVWLVNGPYHPFWSWWMGALIHLRDMPGVPPANRSYPAAEYELMIVSCHPDSPPDPDQSVPQAGVVYMSPPDVVFQFDGVTDEQAVKIAERAVERIAAGQSCDSDFRRWWMEALAATVEHYKAGIHE